MPGGLPREVPQIVVRQVFGSATDDGQSQWRNPMGAPGVPAVLGNGGAAVAVSEPTPANAVNNVRLVLPLRGSTTGRAVNTGEESQASLSAGALSRVSAA